MDASGYETVDGLRYTRFVPGVTARRVRELGGDVAKMLFYVRPDRQGAGSPLADQIRELVRECADEGILLIVELLTYRLDGESEEAYRAAFPGLVADGARLAEACGAKTLKLQYPGSAEGCSGRHRRGGGRAVGGALGGRRPRDVPGAGAHRHGERRERGHGRALALEGQPLDLGRDPGGLPHHARAAAAARARRRGRRPAELM